MKLFISFDLTFKTKEMAEKFDKKNIFCTIDTFQFETENGQTFGLVDSSTIDSANEVKDNVIEVSQRYKDMWAENYYYKRVQNDDDEEEEIEISSEEFESLLKQNSKLVEVFYYIGYDDDDTEEYEVEMSNIEFEEFNFHQIKVDCSDVLYYND